MRLRGLVMAMTAGMAIFCIAAFVLSRMAAESEKWAKRTWAVHLMLSDTIAIGPLNERLRELGRSPVPETSQTHPPEGSEQVAEYILGYASIQPWCLAFWSLAAVGGCLMGLMFAGAVYHATRVRARSEGGGRVVPVGEERA